MGRKGKKTKHSAKELEAKAAASLTNKGGGKAGLADRKGGAAGHSKVGAVVAWAPPPPGTLEWPAARVRPRRPLPAAAAVLTPPCTANSSSARSACRRPRP